MSKKKQRTRTSRGKKREKNHANSSTSMTGGTREDIPVGENHGKSSSLSGPHPRGEDSCIHEDVNISSSTQTTTRKRARNSQKFPGSSNKKRKSGVANGKSDQKAVDDLTADDAAIGTTMKESFDGQHLGMAPPLFPFPTVADDHCESPIEAYRDIAALLESFRMPNLLIYDPYYCDGSVVRHLASLGFSNVYNRNEDCYATWRTKKTPPFDVLITNPPYSGDHMERLVQFAMQSGKPWFLLLPQFVHKKNYFLKSTEKIRPFYLVPKKRYVYIPPRQYREAKKSDVHKKSSPFVSMWYCYGGTSARNESLIHCFRQQSDSTCQLARSRSALRDLRRK